MPCSPPQLPQQTPSHKGSVRRVSRYQFTHVRYQTAAAAHARRRLENWCMRGANWLSETSLTVTTRGWGCWTVHFNSHVQHYSDWCNKLVIIIIQYLYSALKSCKWYRGAAQTTGGAYNTELPNLYYRNSQVLYNVGKSINQSIFVY